MVTESETHDPPPCALTLCRARLVRENVSCAAWRWLIPGRPVDTARVWP